MDLAKFNQTYSYETHKNSQYHVRYRDSMRDVRIGLLLQQPVESVTGTMFVFVDNFANRIPLRDVLEVYAI